jgi:hypothetical protein
MTLLKENKVTLTNNKLHTKIGTTQVSSSIWFSHSLPTILPRFSNRSRLRQRYKLQRTTLTSLFYNFFIKKLYMYIFMKIIFKTNLLI